MPKKERKKRLSVFLSPYRKIPISFPELIQGVSARQAKPLGFPLTSLSVYILEMGPQYIYALIETFI